MNNFRLTIFVFEIFIVCFSDLIRLVTVFPFKPHLTSFVRKQKTERLVICTNKYFIYSLVKFNIHWETFSQLSQ